jgi:hypothetical protein
MIPTTNSTVAQGSLSGRINSAIQLAAARAGVDFSYLFNQARMESGFNPDARARTSSATGLFQFIDQTWLGTVKRHGADHGLGWAADAIREGRNGHYYVADRDMRQAILDLRRQPEAASAMAAEYASDNQDYIQRHLGRAAEPVDLYLAHFLGAAGATRFLRAHDANPDGAAAAILPAAARANRAVFYDRGGSPRSFAEIRRHFAERIGGGAPAMPQVRYAAAVAPESTALRMAARTIDPNDPTGLGTDPARPFGGPSPEFARLAYMMLAGLGA